MSAKTSAARRAAFMVALARTGNQTLAAEHAKVSRSWVQLHRTNDPAFRQECEAAIAAAKARLRGADGVQPEAAWRSAAGEELVVRGSNGRRAQIARARIRQWTPRVEARFLGALATCCNVKAACAHVGLTQASAYNHYNRWPDFAARWDEALALGYGRIEAMMIERACNIFSGGEDDDFEEPQGLVGEMTIPEALQLLHMHKHKLHGIGGRPGRAEKTHVSEAELHISLTRKMDLLTRVRKRGRTDPAEDRAAVARGAAIVAGRGSGERAG